MDILAKSVRRASTYLAIIVSGSALLFWCVSRRNFEPSIEQLVGTWVSQSAIRDPPQDHIEKPTMTFELAPGGVAHIPGVPSSSWALRRAAGRWLVEISTLYHVQPGLARGSGFSLHISRDLGLTGQRGITLSRYIGDPGRVVPIIYRRED